MRRIWLIVDIAIVILTATVGWRYFQSRATAGPAPEDTPAAPLHLGSVLALPEVDWSTTATNIVIRVRTTCPACDSSRAFYRQLSAARGAHHARLIVVSNEPRAEVASWLEASGVASDLIVEVPEPGKLGFLVIPTIALVNRNGVVTDMLVEKLSADEEAGLWARLGDSAIPALDNSFLPREVDTAGLQRLREGNGNIRLLDIRKRDQGRAVGADDDSVSIPYDELSVRAGLELRKQDTIVIGCRAPLVLAQCRLAGRQLRRSGFADVVVYSGAE